MKKSPIHNSSFIKFQNPLDVLKINQLYLHQPNSTELSTTRTISTLVSQHYRRVEIGEEIVFVFCYSK